MGGIFIYPALYIIPNKGVRGMRDLDNYINITAIEIRFTVPIDKTIAEDEYFKEIKESIQLIAVDEYRLSNMIDFDIETTEEKNHLIRAVFSD